MSVAIEKAQTADADAVATILSDWIDETTWMPRIHTRQEEVSFGNLLIDEADVTVARHDAQVIGFLARRGGVIEALYVAASARHRGIGKSLLDQAKSAADGLGLWTFQANVRARAFYAREGFREVETTDGAANDEKLPDVRLIWVKEIVS